MLTSIDNGVRLAAIGTIYYYPSRGKKLLFFLDVLYMAYVLLKERVNLIHCHHRYPAFIASFISHWLRTPVLMTVHNVFPDKSGMSRWGDRLIAVSNAVKNWLLTDCQQKCDDVVVIHNGVETPTPSAPEEIQQLQQALGLLEGVTTFCAVGRLMPQKNYALLVEALGRLKDHQWQIIFIGEGHERSALEKQVSAYQLTDRVHFLGFRADVSTLMQLSDIFVMSSRWEGFPYVIIEASANALPVVSTDVGGISEGVIDGKTGYLVASGDLEGLVERMAQLLGSDALRNEMALSSKRLFQEQFTIDTMLKRTKQQYEQLISDPSSAE